MTGHTRAALVALSLSPLGACTSSGPSRASFAVQPSPDRPEAAATSTPPVSIDDAGLSASARENRLIARMLKKVSAARGLAAKHDVPGVMLDREALIAKVKEHVAREVPPEAIREEGLTLQLFGFVPQPFDYEAQTYALLEAQLAGFYEPKDGTMYMASDLDDDNASATLAHELVHALQDQHFDLKPHSKYVAGASDAQSAFSALAEGDATSAMADVLVGQTAKGKTALDLPEEAFVQQVLESVSIGPAAKAPHVMRTSLVAPYIYGTLFVHALRRRGGWAAVDRAWESLPTTSEQILHPNKWELREAALPVKAPPYATLGEGWQVLDEDTYGELGLRLTFEEWVGKDGAEAAARGWGGDRGVLLRSGNDTYALAIRVRFDSQKAEGAAEALTALTRGFEKTAGKAKVKEAAFTCVERPRLGPLAAMRAGRDLVLVVAPTRTSNTEAGWGAAGDCVLAKKWASEVAAAGGND